MTTMKHVRRWTPGTPSKDPTKIAAELILIEQGFTREEAVYGVNYTRDGLPVNRVEIRQLVGHAKSFIELLRDDLRVGTDLYQGAAYFWGRKYRFWMRGDAHGNGYRGIPIRKARRRIHQRFLDEGLELHGETQRHDEIVNDVFGTSEYKQDEAEGAA